MDTYADPPRAPVEQARRVRMRLLDGVLSAPLCAICAVATDPARDLCGRCEGRLACESPPPLAIAGADASWAARPYVGVARELVARLKFRGRLALARVAAGVIAAEAPEGLLTGVLVPVPASPPRRAWRGFDPAEEIALALARQRGLTLARPLIRERGPRQVGRPRRERIANPPRVHARSPAPSTAIVIDDVSTTGATLGVCAVALRAAGAERVAAIAFAATPTIRRAQLAPATAARSI
jgi:predicted amidophosphoribosyltransferase